MDCVLRRRHSLGDDHNNNYAAPTETATQSGLFYFMNMAKAANLNVRQPSIVIVRAASAVQLVRHHVAHTAAPKVGGHRRTNTHADSIAPRR